MAKEPTKKARKANIRAVLGSYKIGETLSPADMDTLIENAGWKVYSGITAIRVGTNAKAPNKVCTYVSINGVEGKTPWGWAKAIDGLSASKDVDAALRNAIAPQMKAYRESLAPEERKCAKCGCTHIQTDHHETSFDAIKKAFLEVHPVDTIGLNEGEGGIGWQLNDEYRGMWLAFHDPVATYQPLCGPCNSSKGNK